MGLRLRTGTKKGNCFRVVSLKNFTLFWASLV